MLIAQLSDLHVRPPGDPLAGRVETLPMLDAAIEALLRQDPPPDLVLITGDLTDRGRDDEYALLWRALERLPFPLRIVPGNHDHRVRLTAQKIQAIEIEPSLGFVLHRERLRTLTLITLDSLVQGQSAGGLCAARLGWLEQALDAAAGEPVVIALHHPPARCGIGFMDAIRLLDGAEELGRMVERHGRVHAILCGHVHRTMVIGWRGTIILTAPSVAHQVTLELHEGAADSFTLEPPGYLLHHWSETTGLVSHVVPIAPFAGPFPFHDDPAATPSP